MTGRPGRAPSTCEAPGCDAETYTRRCPEHTTRRGTDHRSEFRAAAYQRRWRAGPRAVVLARDPVCVVCGLEPSTVADHHPLERWELVAQGVADPDDPAYLRGCCRRCANRKSAKASHRGR